MTSGVVSEGVTLPMNWNDGSASQFLATKNPRNQQQPAAASSQQASKQASKQSPTSQPKAENRTLPNYGSKKDQGPTEKRPTKGQR